MLKQSASDVLASFRPSTCPRWYASALHSRGPAGRIFWASCAVCPVVPDMQTIGFSAGRLCFSAAC